MSTEHYRAELSKLVRGRPWIVATDVVVGAARHGTRLLDLGAQRVLVIGGSRGTGDIDERLETIELGLRGKDMMDGIRSAEAVLDALPAEVIAQVDAFDPQREALVVRELFSEGRPVAGRRVFGARRPEWLALEDKMIIDAFWDAAGVKRAASRIVRVEEAALAHRDLDQGRGTVWVADNREGWHGGAFFLRWIRRDEDMREALKTLGGVADRVRVMPFLDGVPCSIHGVVFADTEIAFRPCEMMVFRTDSNKLAYASASTYWLPAQSDSDAMREVAIRVGRYLRDTVDYRGCFTVDGVMTSDGFLPTELNPRYGAALGQLAAGLPELPLYLLHLAIVEGASLAYRPSELESMVVRESLKNPSGKAMRIVPETLEPRKAVLVLDEGALRFASEGEQASFSVELGPAASGSILFVRAVPDALELGPALAPRIVDALRFLDDAWNLGLGALEAATDVRG